LGIVIPDVTFHLAKKNDDMYLFSPFDVEQVEGKPFSECSVTDNYDKWVEDERITKTKIKAREFFRAMSEVQFESGYPYVLFEDTANRVHSMKHVGRINMSNLCSEILQVNTPSVYRDDLSYEVVGNDISCNLGSLNVKKMLDLDHEAFIDTVIVATKALDQVSRVTSIDSVPSVRQGNEDSRAIGLGQMNLHGALAHHGLEYGSPEALALWDRYMALVTWAAMLASTEIASKHGESALFEGSAYQTGAWFDKPKKWLAENDDLHIVGGLFAPGKGDWRYLEIEVSKHGMGNAYLQTIPPTGSISYINHSTSSIHPIASKVEIRKEGKVGRVYYPAPHMRTDNLHLYKDAYEVGPEKIIDTYAVSQRWLDQSQSLTLFFRAEATTRDLDRARIYAWTKGIRTMYYVRLRQDAMEGTAVGESIDECVSCQL
jgi:ribonucleoside-diphosphate reductase alpha chain